MFRFRFIALLASVFLASSSLIFADEFSLDKCGPVFESTRTSYSINLGRLKDARKSVVIESNGAYSSATESARPIQGQVGSLQPFDTYLDDLRGVHKELGDHGADTARVHSVFYPLMGSDLALPLLIFPRVKTIVTIDRAPFLPLDQVQGDSPIQIKSALGGAWRAAAHIQDEASIASRLLGSLYDSFPELKILSLDAQVQVPGAGQKPSVSAILRFDLGDGFGERKLVYINETINYRDVASSLDPIWGFQPQAAIFKASMGVAKDGGFGGPPQSFGLTVIDHMRSQSGLILEGLSVEVMGAGGYNGNYSPELSAPFQVNSAMGLHKNARSYILPSHPFGYDKGILVTDFSPSNP